MCLRAHTILPLTDFVTQHLTHVMFIITNYLLNWACATVVLACVAACPRTRLHHSYRRFRASATLASPQTSFGVRLGRNECVTNEPQRTSAGRLHHDGHPRCFKPMYLNFQQLLLFHKMFEIGEIRCIECKEFCLTLSYPRASRLQRAHCSPFLKLKFAFEHLLFKLKYCLWRLLTKRKWGN